jgi:acyl-CoA thioesterase FadM
MNTASYVSAFLNHRFTGLRERLGLDLSALGELPFILVTSQLRVEFSRALRGDEPFEMTSWVSDVGDTDCEVRGEMHAGQGRLAASFQLRIACVSKQTSRAARWSDGFLDRFFEPAGDGTSNSPSS